MDNNNRRILTDWKGTAGMWRDLMECKGADMIKQPHELDLTEYNQVLKEFADTALEVIENHQKAFQSINETGKDLEETINKIRKYARERGVRID